MFLFIQVFNTNLFIIIQLQLPYYFTPINLVQYLFNTLTQDFQYYREQLIFVDCFYNYFLWTQKLDLFHVSIQLFQTIKLMQYMLLLLLPYEIPTSFVKNFPFRTGVKFDCLNWGYVQKIICSYFNFKERSKKAIHVKYPITQIWLISTHSC